MNELNSSMQRIGALLQKEFMQLKRDKVVILLILFVPLIELIFFVYAINTNPRYLPTVVVNADQSPITRTLVSSLQTSSYFKIIDNDASDEQAKKMIANGKATFSVHIPANFTRDLIRGDEPSILVTADATDTIVNVNALVSLKKKKKKALELDFMRGLSYLLPVALPFKTITHAIYNPENITAYSIISGLLGLQLTLTMVLLNSLSIIRERETGTMENLLVTPLKPLEVLIGKSLPYVLIGYMQETLILLCSIFLFDVPFQGSFTLLYLLTFPFIIVNLLIGLFFSLIAKTQRQALQMSLFFFMPSMLLSGFMFPFFGMPNWAQIIGNMLPLTHFLTLARGIMLKGNEFMDVWPTAGYLVIFFIVLLFSGSKFYKKTLD